MEFFAMKMAPGGGFEVYYEDGVFYYENGSFLRLREVLK
jgi:hypothetical protein